MPSLRFFIVLLFLPAALQAQVYRCETAEGTIYSQMPCAENAERLEQYDSPSDTEGLGGEEVPDMPQPRGRTARAEQENSLQHFVSTLEKQRDGQLSTFDASIRRIEQQLRDTSDQGPDEMTRDMLESQLADLKEQRASINEQYTALITEANRRAESGQ